jgi:hypothetical protein
MIFNRSNEFTLQGVQTKAGSNDLMTSPNGDSSQQNFETMKRAGNLSTMQVMINQASDDLTNASLMGNTLAGAKKKYNAQFRLESQT